MSTEVSQPTWVPEGQEFNRRKLSSDFRTAQRLKASPGFQAFEARISEVETIPEAKARLSAVLAEAVLAGDDEKLKEAAKLLQDLAEGKLVDSSVNDHINYLQARAEGGDEEAIAFLRSYCRKPGTKKGKSLWEALQEAGEVWAFGQYPGALEETFGARTVYILPAQAFTAEQLDALGHKASSHHLLVFTLPAKGKPKLQGRVQVSVEAASSTAAKRINEQTKGKAGNHGVNKTSLAGEKYGKLDSISIEKFFKRLGFSFVTPEEEQEASEAVREVVTA